MVETRYETGAWLANVRALVACYAPGVAHAAPRVIHPLRQYRLAFAAGITPVGVGSRLPAKRKNRTGLYLAGMNLERIVALKPDLNECFGTAVIRNEGKPTDVIRY